MYDKTEEIASKHLGKKSTGSEFYDKSLLVAVPRIENRRQYNIKNDNLPFNGYDIWHAYEFSTLTENGLPITRVIKLKYNCESKYLVESKSLKLYLNSFNMSKFGKNIQETLILTKEIIEKDLSEKLETKVEAIFLDEQTSKKEVFSKFINIMDLAKESEIKIVDFKENPSLIKYEETNQEKKYYLKFDSLRSNCRVTHQPDFGDAFIYYKSQRHINESSLVEYLTSFRAEYHFHEECVEMIFKRLNDILNPDDELCVCALYTRRGGIDITPLRWKNCELDDVNFILDLNCFARNGIKQ